MTPRLLRRPLVTVLASVLATSLWLPLLPGGAAAAGVQPPPAGRRVASWEWPLWPAPAVVRGFEPPAGPYGPGHRGIDLAGQPGDPVLAVADGTVSFAGWVAGHGVVVVDHGLLRSTYLPVTPAVSRGARVLAGQPIGTLQSAGSHCAPAVCLHLGARRGDVYIDPMPLLPQRPIRLLPLAGLGPSMGSAWLPEWPWATPSGAWVGLGIRGP